MDDKNPIRQIIEMMGKERSLAGPPPPRDHQDHFRRMKFLGDLRTEIEKYRKLHQGDERTRQVFREVDKAFFELAGKEIKQLDKEAEKRIQALLDQFTKNPQVRELSEDNRNGNKKHNPLHTVSFLKKFCSTEDTKFITHEWDRSKGNFNYPIRMKEAEARLIKLRKEDFPEVASSTYNKVRSFLLESNFDKKPNAGWGFFGIPFGWSSPELKNWCEQNPGIYPNFMEIPPEKKDQLDGEGGKIRLSTFGDVINKFKREIEFRNEGNHLLSFLYEKMMTWRVREEFEVEFNEQSLVGVSFYADVDRFATGLKYIMNPLKDRKENKKIKFSAEKDGGLIKLKLLHVGSTITRYIDEGKIRKSTLTGDFEVAHRNLTGQCDWSMEGRFNDGEYWKINYLSYDEKPELEPSQFREGVLHTFTFYQPTV